MLLYACEFHDPTFRECYLSDSITKSLASIKGNVANIRNSDIWCPNHCFFFKPDETEALLIVLLRRKNMSTIMNPAMNLDLVLLVV